MLEGFFLENSTDWICNLHKYSADKYNAKYPKHYKDQSNVTTYVFNMLIQGRGSVGSQNCDFDFDRNTALYRFKDRRDDYDL